MRKIDYKEKGITLVALVITIIILLILAGVALTTALGQNGLFERAKVAGENYKSAEADESKKLVEVDKEIDKMVDGEDSQDSPVSNIPEEMQVGDVVNYTPDTTTTYNLTSDKSGYDTEQTVDQETYTWKVLNINNDSVDIMGVPTSSMPTVYFRGSTGYNNGVYCLDELCKTLYSNNKLRAEARSIDLQDIEAKMNTTGKNARGTWSNAVKYGETKVYSSNQYYPNLAMYENILGIDNDIVNTSGIGESNDGTKLEEITIPLLESNTSTFSSSKSMAKKKMTVKQNYYELESPSECFDDSKFYDVIFGTGTEYWLASRSSLCDNSDAAFGLRCVKDSQLTGYDLFFSYNLPNTNTSYHVAPIVSLDSNVKYTSAGDGKWNIS